MEYNIPDDILGPLPFDIAESIHYGDELRIHDLAYDQLAPQSTHHDPEQNNATSGSAFGLHITDQSTVIGYDLSGLESSSLSLENPIVEWAQGNSVLVGAANQHNDPWNHLMVAGLNSHYQQPPFPMRELPSQSTPDGSPVDQQTLSSSHSSDDKDSTADRIQCGWDGCLSQDIYGRDRSLWRHIRNEHIPPNSYQRSGSQGGKSFKCGWEDCESQHTSSYGHHSCLWRHIKEKHILKDIYECPAPRCGKLFGRKDKMIEHLRGRHAENAKTRQGDSPLS